jgi:cation:H+ antiporter
LVVWLQFIVCTALILFSGSKLSFYGDIIAEKTGMGRNFIGVVLMAAVTSLPELITGVSSVTIFDLPNIAAGDVLGSCMFNMLIIAMLDFMGGSTPLSARAHQGQVLGAGFGILLLGLVGISLFGSAALPRLGWISFTSLVFLGVYLIAIRTVFLYERRRIVEFVKEIAEEAKYGRISKARAFAMYGLNAAVIIAAATYLPHLGERNAELTGLGRTFVGSIFVALSTSLPEVVVSLGAVRIGAVDIALGNLFGSNLFNIGMLAVDDMLYTRGPLLLHISANHLVSVLAAIIMTAIAIIGLTYQTTTKRHVFAWDSIALVLVYVSATLVLYLTGIGVE